MIKKLYSEVSVAEIKEDASLQSEVDCKVL